jgi:hypothetical protein
LCAHLGNTPSFDGNVVEIKTNSPLPPDLLISLFNPLSDQRVYREIKRAGGRSEERGRGDERALRVV